MQLDLQIFPRFLLVKKHNMLLQTTLIEFLCVSIDQRSKVYDKHFKFYPHTYTHTHTHTYTHTPNHCYIHLRRSFKFWPDGPYKKEGWTTNNSRDPQLAPCASTRHFMKYLGS